MPELEPVVCYQSQGGPAGMDRPLHRCRNRSAPGRDGKGVIVAPVAFVSEHSETLVELDIEYRKLAAEAGVPDYRRAATVGAHSDFIKAWPALVRRAAGRRDCHRPVANGAHLPAGSSTLRL